MIALPTSYNFGSWATLQVVNSLHDIAYTLSFDPEIIHIFGLVNPSAALAALSLALTVKAKRRKVRLFLDWDDLWSEGTEGILRDYNFFIRTLGYLLEHRTLSFGDAVTVVSEYLECRARNLTTKAIFRVPNGCDVDNVSFIRKTEARMELGLPIDAPVLVHVGFTDLTHAFDIVRKIYPRTRLVIVGSPPRFVSLRIPKLQRTAGITYTGSVPQTQVSKYLASADILVLKQENEATEMARWPIRFGDYLAAGRAIVTGYLGEVGRIMSDGKCGLTAKPGDQADFALQIINLLGDSEARDIFGKNAGAIAKELAWAKVAKTLASIYYG
jgi:glycosyltransferase involved in cell wall biosynthesis